MGKIDIGHGVGESTTVLRVLLNSNSTLELKVGEARDMSTREIQIVERPDSGIPDEVARLQELVAKLQAKRSSNHRRHGGAYLAGA